MHNKKFRANFKFLSSICIIMIILSLISIVSINWRLKQHALDEAKEKAMILLDRNMATHTYFSHQLKPVLFEKLKDISDEKYFEPRWMSSTYAVREIDEYYKSVSKGKYYYKEAAIDARSPENEADKFEKNFIQKTNKYPDIKELSKVKFIDGSPFLVVLRRGETMEQNCLRCHSEPEMAPKELLEYYGSDRSFARYEGEVVSAISIRIPLASAYSDVNQIILFLSALSIFVLLMISGLATFLGKRWIYDPISYIGSKAKDISENPQKVGVQIDLPASKELSDLGSAFNSMSSQLKEERDQLEKTISERTQELRETNSSLEKEVRLKEKTINDLEKAMSRIKTLSGLLPICTHCKKIRDDKGYWNQIESYLEKHSDVSLGHSICRECAEKYYPDYDIYGN
uniref:c-type heme family protein n=1 Tax=Candidatus Electrothrix sp. TaxID=2170559 RepID=UPI0040574FF9